MVRRKVSESIKKQVAGKQRYTCATIPNYTCPMGGKPFDESGYDIDHIQELRHGGTNDITNLQALCPPCHRVKTARNHSKPQEPVQAEVPVSKKIEPKYTTLKHIYKDVLISGRVIRIMNKSEDPTN